MKTQIKRILEAKRDLSENGQYIAVFEDGRISEILTEGTVPNPSEGNYVRIFRKDHPSDIEAKLGSLVHP